VYAKIRRPRRLAADESNGASLPESHAKGPGLHGPSWPGMRVADYRCQMLLTFRYRVKDKHIAQLMKQAAAVEFHMEFLQRGAPRRQGRPQMGLTGTTSIG
jgi:hypothetical protein